MLEPMTETRRVLHAVRNGDDGPSEDPEERSRSIGSIGSYCSIGSVGSSFSIGSVGSFCSIGSVLSGLSFFSMLAGRRRTHR